MFRTSNSADPARYIPVLAAALCALLALAPRPLAAQDSASEANRDASARSLFQEGIVFAEQSDWQSAEDRFRRALSLRSSPVIAYNLATALATRGKLVEASELLRKITLEPGLDAKLRQSVGALQAEVAPRLARVRIKLEQSRTGDIVRINGAKLHEAQLGVDIPFDPGSQRITLERAGRLIDDQTVELGSGGTTDVTLRTPTPPLNAEPIASSASATAPAAALQADRGSALTSKWWFWAGVGVVTAAVVVAVVAASSSSDPKPARSYDGDFDPPSIPVEVEP